LDKIEQESKNYSIALERLQIKDYCTPGLQALVECYQTEELSEIENMYLALASVLVCILIR
jgi:hypothetical protein